MKQELATRPLRSQRSMLHMIEAWRGSVGTRLPRRCCFPPSDAANPKARPYRVRRRTSSFWRIRPIARKLGIPDRLATFQVIRRSLGTHLQEHGTLKDTQSVLRHASITTTGNVYVQVIEASVMRAVNSHATAVLDGWTPTVASLGLKGRNIRSVPAEKRDPEAIR